jgi:putative Flp pilus-assembly TadE/G-like protein
MPRNQRGQRAREAERGISLFLVAVGMVMLLGILGLGVDLVSLYVARSEAQRAADAAALAGATVFVTTGCTSASGGCVAGGPQEAPARQRAIDVGSQNQVGGQAPTILAGDITFAYPTPEDPTITVTVARDASHGGPMPTFFAKIFGVLSANVSALATAEAYNPSGGGPPVGTSCVKPWVLPNCDSGHTTPASTFCPGFATFINSNGTISNPGLSSAGGVIGELILLKSGNPQFNVPAPSQYYPITMPEPPNTLCPSCGSPSSGTNGAALYRSNIECCNGNQLVCGAQGTIDLSLKPGDMQGPTVQGVSCLIHQSPGNGEDTLNMSPSPYQYIAGANNPFFPKGTVISSSDSVITVPLYDGHNICPGGSCSTNTVTIIGFLQVFVRDVVTSGTSRGNVEAYVLNISGCGSGSGGQPPVSGGSGGGGGSPIPVRLIHN